MNDCFVLYESTHCSRWLPKGWKLLYTLRVGDEISYTIFKLIQTSEEYTKYKQMSNDVPRSCKLLNRKQLNSLMNKLSKKNDYYEIRIGIAGSKLWKNS